MIYPETSPLLDLVPMNEKLAAIPIACEDVPIASRSRPSGGTASIYRAFNAPVDASVPDSSESARVLAGRVDASSARQDLLTAEVGLDQDSFHVADVTPNCREVAS